MYRIEKVVNVLINIVEACRLVLQRSGEKYISGITEFEGRYDIGIAYEDGDTPDGYHYCVNKSTGEVGTGGSYEMFKKHDDFITQRRVPDEFRCPNYDCYRDYPE